MRRNAILVLLLGLSACSTYSVRRSALVPHMVPPMYSGQPVDGAASVGLQNSTVVLPVEPVEAQNANAGLYVARTNVGAGVRARITRDLDVGPLFELGPEQGSMPIATDMPDRPHQGATYGAGVGVRYSIQTGAERLRIGLALDTLAYSIPYFEQGTCVENCVEGQESYQETGRHLVGVYSFSVLPSYRVGRTVIFGGATVRNHPTNFKGSVQSTPDLDNSAEVNAGPPNLMLGAGAEVELSHGMRAYVQLFQPVTQDPVVYGPSVGIGLSATFGRRSSDRM